MELEPEAVVALDERGGKVTRVALLEGSQGLLESRGVEGVARHERAGPIQEWLELLVDRSEVVF